MPARERRSRGELIRQRAQAHFVGRRAQLSLFTENLAKDPLAEADPADFLFHVRGVGGVGKSTLLRQWREAAQRAGAVTAVVDENDVHGVPQALAELARQLAAGSGPMKGFDREVEQFRRNRAAAAEPVPADGAGPAGGEASLSSRVMAQATLGAVSLIPGAGVVTAMASPESAAQGLDRLRGAGARGRRGRGSDATGLSRAFVGELDRMGGQHPWVVLFLDTWELTGRYLDQWLRDLVQDTYGPLPANVMVVLAGRDELSERDWAPLRAVVVDLPLEVFTEAETRALLAVRGVTEPTAVEAALELSMGLPLLVELLALTRPATAGDIRQGGDAVDAVVERFVQWISDPRERETVLACALAPQLNEDVFAAAAPREGRDLWEWLCGQPFVTGHGDFKQYHAVVRASMVRHQRTHSPERWASAHRRLADAHAAWREDAERRLFRTKRWGDPRWRRHHLAETYHRLCAHPAAGLEKALEVTAHAAGQDTAVLREWTDTYEQAARDTGDPALLSWAERFQAAADGDPALAVLSALSAHGGLTPATRAWVHTHRGRRLLLTDRADEALAEVDRALAIDPGHARAWAYRGRIHAWQDRTDQAVSDLTTALDLDPTDAWALAERGEAHREAGRHDDAIADLTAALALDPTDAWTLAGRGQAHREAGRHDDAIADLTAALALDPTLARALTGRGQAHRGAGRHDDAVTDLTAALALKPTDGWILAQRGVTHWAAGRDEEAVHDLTAALDLDPTLDWVLSYRGRAYGSAGRHDEAVADFTAVLALDPTNAWVLASRGQAYGWAGRHDDAIADLTAALALDPTLDWALASRGQAYGWAGRHDDAIADLTAALALDPTLDWALASRGQAYGWAGRHDDAVADFTAALDLGFTDAPIFVQRGRAHRAVGRYDAAIADFTAALALDPTDALVLAQRGDTHQLAGHLDDAVTDLTAALALDPTLDRALTVRGEVHHQAGRYDAAIADFTAALALDPTNALVLAQRGDTHQLAGHLDDAVTDLTAALDLDPTLDWTLAVRGEAHRQAGRHDDAVTDFTAALDLDPTDAWTLGQRGVAHRQAGDLALARRDFARAAALDGEDQGLLFETLVLDTVASGLAACEERWAELLRTPQGDPTDDTAAVFGLLRVLLLEPDRSVPDATRTFLAAHPEPDTVNDLLLHLRELGGVGGPRADRARLCRQLIPELLRG
ncbi:tetratricopeptide repeat protein [Streptomyces griseoflavus]|uniref:tetratricopeptide repeat protein n=1 Tax=Streptomyces griseoflavus TaxID=35619 RepID=UPI0037FCA09E